MTPYDITSGSIDAFFWVILNLMFWGPLGFFLYRIISKRKTSGDISTTRAATSLSQTSNASDKSKPLISQVQNTTGFGLSRAATPLLNTEDALSRYELVTMTSENMPTSGSAEVSPDWPLPYASSGYMKPAGWYKDPSQEYSKRYFDGHRWTLQVRDNSGKEFLQGQPKTPNITPPNKSPVQEWEIDDSWSPPRQSSGYLKNAGWHKDPSGRYKQRFFDGTKWTNKVKDYSGNEKTLVRPEQVFLNEAGLTMPSDSIVSGPESRPDVMTRLSKSTPSTNQHRNATNDVAKDLIVLSELFEKGLLTSQEFATAKSRLLEQG